MTQGGRAISPRFTLGGVLSKTVRVALCYPWYAGPDPYASTYFLEQMFYYGRLQERSHWMNNEMEWGCNTTTQTGPNGLPSLSSLDATGQADLTEAERGIVFQFSTCIEMFCSLPGMARERIVESCLAADVDYLFWTDDDMVFEPSTFLRLYRNNVDICAALAFTARKPITPVIYKFTETEKGLDSQPVWDYKPDALQEVDAFGSGVFLAKADVYRKMGKPWYSSYGCGEDIYFCSRLREHGIKAFVDTRIRTVHKATAPLWHSEDSYLAQQHASGGPVPA